MRFEAVFDALAPASPYDAPQKRSRELAQEHPLSVYLNETPVYRMVCTPTLLPELVLGRLLTEGVIDAVSEVQALRFCNQGLRARVFLNHPPEVQPGAEPIPSCCTGNRTLTQLASSQKMPKKLTPIAYDPSWISRLAACLTTDMPLSRQTRATHGAFLMQDGEVLVAAEDLGRHNALDKAVGWAMNRDVDLHRCLLFTTGRMPVDMVQKAIRAGIPVLCSKARPTLEGVLLAKEFGLTLLGEADEKTYTVYHNGGESR